MLHLLPFSTLLLITSTYAAATPKSSDDPLPLIIWHGLGDQYDSEGLNEVAQLAEKTNPGTYTYIVRLDKDPGTDKTATFLGNLTEQIAQVCEQISADPILSSAPGINALGFSQGGQFLRGYIERCNNPPVKNLVTYGSQHNGINKYQECGSSDWICKGWVGLLKSNTWSSYVQSKVVPAQYFRSTDETTGEASEDYLEYSNFLADINNERAKKNETYAKNIASLENFVMYIFDDDVTVIPKESGWFAEVDLDSKEVTSLRDRKIYKEDWIGLKKLDEKGGLTFKTTEGAHMQLSDKDLVNVFKTYFAPPTSNWERIPEMVQEWLEL